MTRRRSSIPPWGATALCAFAMLLSVSPRSGNAQPPGCPAFDHGHAAFSKLLARYVQAGSVDYTGWKREGRPALDDYRRTLAGVSPACFAAFSREEQIAFLLNAYNASTVALVLEHLPVGSIRDIGFLPGSAFRREFIRLPAVAAGEVSLDDIEHETLRKNYPEPRVHFALVCAARSCPPLRPEAYRAGSLPAQLDDQGRIFLSDPARNRFDAARGALQLSQIFEWFEEDFVAAAGSVGAFVAAYLPEPAATAARNPSVRIGYLDYDWSLNGK